MILLGISYRDQSRLEPFMLHRLKKHLSFGAKARIKSFCDPLISVDSHRTYSQFGEDAYLYSYFKGKTWAWDSDGGHFGPMPPGFYVDVGCYSPMECSNTYLFYRAGWKGINIDPTPGVKEVFDRIRSRDINLQVGVSETQGTLDFYSWGSPCGFNTACPEVAAERERSLGCKPAILQVEMKPLASILDEHLDSAQPISFLTVDVEGHDLSVLASNNWMAYRPKLVVVESEIRNIDEVVESQVFKMMRDVDYRFLAWLPPSLIFADASLNGNR